MLTFELENSHRGMAFTFFWKASDAAFFDIQGAKKQVQRFHLIFVGDLLGYSFPLNFSSQSIIYVATNLSGKRENLSFSGLLSVFLFACLLKYFGIKNDHSNWWVGSKQDLDKLNGLFFISSSHFEKNKYLTVQHATMVPRDTQQLKGDIKRYQMVNSNFNSRYFAWEKRLLYLVHNIWSLGRLSFKIG